MSRSRIMILQTLAICIMAQTTVGQDSHLEDVYFRDGQTLYGREAEEARRNDRLEVLSLIHGQRESARRERPIIPSGLNYLERYSRTSYTGPSYRSSDDQSSNRNLVNNIRDGEANEKGYPRPRTTPAPRPQPLRNEKGYPQPQRRPDPRPEPIRSEKGYPQPRPSPVPPPEPFRAEKGYPQPLRRPEPTSELSRNEKGYPQPQPQLRPEPLRNEKGYPRPQPTPAPPRPASLRNEKGYPRPQPQPRPEPLRNEKGYPRPQPTPAPRPEPLRNEKGYPQPLPQTRPHPVRNEKGYPQPQPRPEPLRNEKGYPQPQPRPEPLRQEKGYPFSNARRSIPNDDNEFENGRIPRGAYSNHYFQTFTSRPRMVAYSRDGQADARQSADGFLDTSQVNQPGRIIELTPLDGRDPIWIRAGSIMPNVQYPSGRRALLLYQTFQEREDERS